MYSIDFNAEGKVLDRGTLLWFIQNFTLVTFNGINYDGPMMRLAMSGASVQRLKECNDMLITRGVKWWHIDQYFPEMVDLRQFGLDLIDIMEPTPGVRIGLKAYMGRMHSRTIQDLPFDPHTPMAYEMRAITDTYCGNDLIGTRELRDTVQERLDLRIRLGEKYGVDIRSKSDAQMAEAVIKTRLGETQRRYVPDGYEFHYVPPPYIQYYDSTLQAVLQTVRTSPFVVRDVEEYDDDIFDDDGKKIKTGVKIPKAIKGTVINIDGKKYKLGIGGLHSQEKGISHYATPGVKIVLIDVKSYYPSLIATLKMFPVQLGQRWLDMYINDIVERLKAKGVDPILADGLKIFLNGTFGKLFSKHSIFFAPEMGIAVTMTGQLALLMLIRWLVTNGIEVISANTDGLVCKVPNERDWLMRDAVKLWETVTGLEMEFSQWRSVHSISVNSYVAFDTDGKITRKGMFAKSGVTGKGVPLAGAHPDRDICIEAAIAYLQHGTPVHKTIRACQDIRMFVTLRGVKGGGQWRGQWLGKVVRWYYSTDGDPITYCSNGNRVADSSGARPCMTLPDSLPADIDYAVYEAYAVKLLQMAGVQ